MKLLVVGDIHIGKKFNTYKPNQYSDGVGNLRQIWTESTISYIEDAIDNHSDVDAVIFLGDIFDSPSLRPELIHLFYGILQKLESYNIETHIIVGNHDTVEPQNPKANLLTMFSSMKNVYVYDKLTVVNDNMIMFPYYKRDMLNDTLTEMLTLNVKYPIIFSHNDIYVNDTLIMTEMIPVDNIRQLFNNRVAFFNGHIHNFHYEPTNGIFFTGSVSPTSFKDSPTASGICYVDIDDELNVRKFKKLLNTKIVFVTIDNINYIDKLQQLLNEYRESNTKVVLRYYPKMRDIVEKEILIPFADVVIYHKEHDANEDSHLQELSLHTQKEIEQVSLKIRDMVYGTINKDDVVNQLNEFLYKKYGFGINNIEPLQKEVNNHGTIR